MKSSSQKFKFDPFRAINIGMSNTGKSYFTGNWVIDMLKEGRFKAKNVIIFSRTAMLDTSQQTLINYCQEKYKKFIEENIFQDIDWEFIKRLMDVQQQLKEKGKPLSDFLLIFDDQLASEGISKRSNTVVKELLCISRHMRISCIWLLQSWKNSLLPVARQQMSDVFIFKLASTRDITDLLECFDQGAGQTTREAIANMKHWHDLAAQSESRCLHIHCHVAFGSGRLEIGNTGQFFDLMEQ